MLTGILVFQVPGGMLSNFRNQLAEQGMGDKFDEVVREIPVVREALGWIPLVTPTSQIVGTQAMMNVRSGRWKMICQPAQDIALGKYGKAPGPPVAPPAEVKTSPSSSPAPVAAAPSNGGLVRRMALTIDGQRHDVSVQKLDG